MMPSANIPAQKTAVDRRLGDAWRFVAAPVGSRHRADADEDAAEMLKSEAGNHRFRIVGNMRTPNLSANK